MNNALNLNSIKFKITYSLIVSFSLLFSGCTSKEDEAKKLGFNGYEEMQKLQTLGYKNKKEYTDQLAAQEKLEKFKEEEAKLKEQEEKTNKLALDAANQVEKTKMADNCYVRYNSALNAKIKWARAFFQQNGYNEMQAGAIDINNYELIAGLKIAFEDRNQLGLTKNLDDDRNEFYMKNYTENYTASSLDNRISTLVKECNNYYSMNAIKSESKKLLTDSLEGNPHQILSIFKIKRD